MQEQPIRPEYVLTTRTEHIGTVLLFLFNDGRTLDMGKVFSNEAQKFYRLIGVREPRTVNLESILNGFPEGNILTVEPDMQLYYGEESHSLADALETLDAKISNVKILNPDLLSSEWLLAASYFVPSLIGIVFGLITHQQSPAYWIGNAVIGVATGSCVRYYQRKISKRTSEEAKKALALYKEVHKSLLNAGVESGIFPPEYGLR